MKILVQLRRLNARSRWYTRPDGYEAPLYIDESKIKREFDRYEKLTRNGYVHAANRG